MSHSDLEKLIVCAGSLRLTSFTTRSQSQTYYYSMKDGDFVQGSFQTWSQVSRKACDQVHPLCLNDLVACFRSGSTVFVWEPDRFEEGCRSVYFLALAPAFDLRFEADTLTLLIGSDLAYPFDKYKIATTFLAVLPDTNKTLPVVPLIEGVISNWRVVLGPRCLVRNAVADRVARSWERQGDLEYCARVERECPVRLDRLQQPTAPGDSPTLWSRHRLCHRACPRSPLLNLRLVRTYRLPLHSLVQTSVHLHRQLDHHPRRPLPTFPRPLDLATRVLRVDRPVPHHCPLRHARPSIRRSWLTDLWVVLRHLRVRPADLPRRTVGTFDHPDSFSLLWTGS